MTFAQAEFDVRCEWGANGVATLAPISDAVVIVDVFSFSTTVSIATARGATVYPYRGRAESAAAFAASLDAELAGRRGQARYSLSPASLVSLPAGVRLVLPSPNGATLSLATGDTPTFAGCLRNARAVAEAAGRFGEKIAVVPCGERWWEDGTLRPALEDLAGAGAIISHLVGIRSPEAEAAVAVFRSMAGDPAGALRRCASGKELIAKGFADDIPFVAAVDADDCAPRLTEGAYVRVE